MYVVCKLPHTTWTYPVNVFSQSQSNCVRIYFCLPQETQKSPMRFSSWYAECACVRGGGGGGGVKLCLDFRTACSPLSACRSLSLVCVCLLFFSFLIARPENLYLSALWNVKHNTQDQKVPI